MTRSFVFSVVCIPCGRGNCVDSGLCKGAVLSLGGASRLFTSLCQPGSFEWVDTQSSALQSRCFNGQYSLFLRDSVGFLVTSNQSPWDIEFNIGGSISPVAAGGNNKTTAVYESCQWRAFRVSVCGGTFSVHHMRECTCNLHHYLFSSDIPYRFLVVFSDRRRDFFTAAQSHIT